MKEMHPADLAWPVSLSGDFVQQRQHLVNRLKGGLLCVSQMMCKITWELEVKAGSFSIRQKMVVFCIINLS